MADQQQQQQPQQQSPPGFKRMSLDKIIEAMTADLENSAGHYVQFGVPQQAPSQNWSDYTNPQCQQRFNIGAPTLGVPSPGNPQTALNPLAAQMYMPEAIASYDSNRAPEPIYFPPQTVNRLGINEKNDLVGTIDVGGGNYIDVIYGSASQLVAEQRQRNGLCSYSPPGIRDREYGLFADQQQQLSLNQGKLASQSPNGKQLIDNLVGNWAPNQSGTYSPFGGSPNVTPAPQSHLRENSTKTEILPRATIMDNQQQKKPRMIAEVKPMRPSYSDVLTKSVPQTVPSMSSGFGDGNGGIGGAGNPGNNSGKTNILEATMGKKIAGKNGKNKGGKTILLKRQNSSGSDDHGSPKIHVPKRTAERNNSSLSRRWVSLDNLGTQIESHDIDSFNRSENFEKKKKVETKTTTTSTTTKKCEKNGEALNNCKLQNSCGKSAGNVLQKRPIQINNNLNNVSSNFGNANDSKSDKNHQYANNRPSKDEKKAPKEKNSKRFHAEKAQQIKKGQKNRYRDTRESPVKDLYRNFNKYAGRWSKFGLKIFYWLLHLISDVASMSTNLVVQFGKCLWYHTVLYMKYSWSYVVTTFSKVQFFNTFGKRIDDFFGDSKFAFWRKMRSKKKNEEKKEDHRGWMHGGLEANIALPNTGEEAMKRLLACKGKDPYSILGVTPTCSDDDIKKYYKRQAFLVHPDKNSQPGAEEAFKILVHAFDIIGVPERRKGFDQVWQVEAAWGEMSGLLSQLHRKMEQAANTIRCTNCGLRHKRVPTQRPCYAARFCAQCKIRHSAKEGDIWAESRIMGFLWHYYACMEGAVYDVTEWAACQASNLKHLRANTHSVQYRIVSGQRPSSQTAAGGKKRQQNDPSTSEADLEDFLNNLYNHSKSGAASGTTGEQTSTKSDNRRRKAKRK